MTDNCGTGASIIMTHNDVWENGGDCNSFKVTRTWTAVDPCGNESIASQTLTLMDNIAPVFETTLLDKTVGCGDAIIFDQVEVTENCSNAQVSFTDSAVDLCGGSYAITRTWLAEDACGNVSSASQTVTVMDDEGPVFDMVPADKTISCGEALVFGQAEASDDCSFAELSFEDEMTLSCEGSYTVTRTWTATDGCGNISQAQQKITVEDTQAPVFETVVVDQYISCGEQPVFATVAAADACSNVSVTFVDVEEVLACETLVTRTWTAVDACGNSAQLSQSVHIMDNDSPVFNALPTSLEMTQAEFMAWTLPTAIATDCGEVTIEVNSSSESNCDFITYTYNYVATDGCGNSSSHHLEVLITDAVFAMTVEAPAELDCGENYDLLLNTVNGTAPFAYSWQIVSGTNWQVDAMPGQPMATVLAGEGEAVLNVSIMDAVGCVVSQSIILDCEEGVNAVTIAEISSFELKPNPVNDVLRVAFYSKIAGEAKVKVLNTLGSQMALTTNDVTLGSNQFEVETASLPAGTYLLQLQLGDKMMVEKFVKIN
ncbi:MAG: T9SS type A sorting domain-containing protein [Saprospiraceae bacterium]